MLTLNPGSACDVCAEEYGPHCVPHSIPCGHVLCATCCSTIVEKTSPRLTPVCPFCREHFTSDTVRLIRMDFTSSGWSTPRQLPATIETKHNDFASDAWARKAERLLLTEGGCSRTRAEARRLEDKVAKVAAKKCSVEEVSTLHKELQEWLTSDVKQDDQTSSLYLSAALLRAILMNHLAHSEASKTAKSVETHLKGKLDDMEIMNGKLDAELRRQRLQYSQKAQECQTLRTELSRLKVVTTTLGVAPSSQPEPRHQSPTSPTPPSTSPTPPVPYSPSAHLPISRFNSVHMRSASVQSSSRPSTPSPSVRSHTPSPSTRSHTPTPSIRSHNPTHSVRSRTPAPPVPPIPPMRLPTPGPVQLRSQTPAPPPTPPRPRRLSHSTPPKMIRTPSEENQEVHQRWIPHTDPDSHGPSTGKPNKFAPMTLLSRTASLASAAAARYKDTRSPSP